jgi:hypothetical protein
MKLLGLLVVPVFALTPILAFTSSAQASHREVNGCGNDSGSGGLVPNQPNGVDFRPACDNHDKCYGILGISQLECDDKFQKELRARCEKELLRSVGGVLVTSVTGGAALANCYKLADSYYAAVRRLGNDSYQKAQDHAQEEVQQTADLYRTILGREPEPGAVDGLVSRLANGSTLAQERQVMANSEESRNNAVNLYRNILGRDPEPGAAEGIVSRLANDSTLARERQVMANSEESRNNLANLYRTILGREPEAGAVDGLVSRLANGSTLAQEREIMANSEEARRRRGL